MEKIFSKYLRGDTTIWLVFIFLCIFSVVELYSASSYLAFKSQNYNAPILQHVAFLLVGALIAFIVHFIPYKYIRVAAYLGLLVSFILLVYVILHGEATNDANRWVKILGIKFQPSEIAKLSLIIVVADLISRIRANPAEEKKYFIWILAISITIVGLIFLENFSTAAILAFTIYAMMFIGKVSWKKLTAIAGIVILLAFVGYSVVKIVPSEKMPSMFDRAYTWVARIDRAFDGEEENKYIINDENRQVQNGRIAVARGGFFGVMPGNSVQRDYLPHAYDDFIFAIIIEEMGVFGGLVIMFLYLVLLFRTGQIATVCKTSFPAILVTGLGLIITLQATVNMIVGSGFGLVTGQPLPLISRGGTSILVTCVYFGIILGVIREIKAENEKEKEIKDKEISIENVEDNEETYDL